MRKQAAVLVIVDVLSFSTAVDVAVSGKGQQCIHCLMAMRKRHKLRQAGSVQSWPSQGGDLAINSAFRLSAS